MSRFYEMTMEISNPKKDGILSVKDKAAIKTVFKKEWGEDQINWIDDPTHKSRESQTATYFGNGNLCGGELEKEAHDRIVKAVKTVVPTCSVLTRWTCLEYLPYEEYVD